MHIGMSQANNLKRKVVDRLNRWKGLKPFEGGLMGE